MTYKNIKLIYSKNYVVYQFQSPENVSIFISHIANLMNERVQRRVFKSSIKYGSTVIGRKNYKKGFFILESLFKFFTKILYNPKNN